MSDSGAEGAPPADWYPDPQAPPGRTGRRYWDGTAWTEHVVADPLPVGPPTTPDGRELASWGRRLGAYLIDGVITWVVTVVLAFPFLRSMVSDYKAFVGRALDAAGSGGQPPGQLEIYRQLFPALVGYAAVALVVLVVYHSLFLRTRSATPGKLVLGLRVQPSGHPGRLPWRTIATRLGSTNVAALVLSLVPLVGGLISVYFLVDGLWPLWDHRRQALHDKLSGTSVVRV